jgi:hypothetical protein
MGARCSCRCRRRTGPSRHAAEPQSWCASPRKVEALSDRSYWRSNHRLRMLGRRCLQCAARMSSSSAASMSQATSANGRDRNWGRRQSAGPAEPRSQPPPWPLNVAVAVTRRARGVAYAEPSRPDTNRGLPGPCAGMPRAHLRDRDDQRKPAPLRKEKGGPSRPAKFREETSSSATRVALLRGAEVARGMLARK